MPKYVIERTVPGARELSDEQAQGISQQSCGMLKELGPEIQWVESFVTDDKIYWSEAPSEEVAREHARLGGFPVDSVAQARRMIDPTTAGE